MLDRIYVGISELSVSLYRKFCSYLDTQAVFLYGYGLYNTDQSLYRHWPILHESYQYSVV